MFMNISPEWFLVTLHAPCRPVYLTCVSRGPREGRMQPVLDTRGVIWRDTASNNNSD